MTAEQRCPLCHTRKGYTTRIVRRRLWQFVIGALTIGGMIGVVIGATLRRVTRG